MQAGGSSRSGSTKILIGKHGGEYHKSILLVNYFMDSIRIASERIEKLEVADC